MSVTSIRSSSLIRGGGGGEGENWELMDAGNAEIKFLPFWTLTFDDLSRPQMTSDGKNSNKFILSLVSAFQKHIVWKKSKNHFSGPFSSTCSMGWNDPHAQKQLQILKPQVMSFPMIYIMLIYEKVDFLSFPVFCTSLHLSSKVLVFWGHVCVCVCVCWMTPIQLWDCYHLNM